ncbi:MAG: UbiA family prenyltransferase [Candidatus Tectomicrobia bacterium]|nr:UbiA family prenyltransferase [Candidatus Tectomicrobia bacterium]
MSGLARAVRKVGIVLDMIKFQHSIFALPFALSSALLAAQGLPSGWQMFWILVAMVAARSGAMGLNRLFDAEIDRQNPRTRFWAIPAGLVTKREAGVFSIAALGAFVLAAAALNPLCLLLSPIAVAALVITPLTKRYTTWTHLFLGLCQFLAPVGAWIAIRGSLTLTPLLLGAAAGFWVAGFDIFYHFQDLEYDKRVGLRSIPVSFGVRASLMIVRLFHAIMFLSLISIVALENLKGAYIVGVLLIGALLLYEHSLIRPGNLSRLNRAFFAVNGWISMAILLFTVLDLFLL